jgi:hypothetical protein
VGDLASRGIDAAAFCARLQVEFEDSDDAIQGISALYRNGIVVRVLSRRLETIYSRFRQLWSQVRSCHLGLRASPLRK